VRVCPVCVCSVRVCSLCVCSVCCSDHRSLRCFANGSLAEVVSSLLWHLCVYSLLRVARYPAYFGVLRRGSFAGSHVMAVALCAYLCAARYAAWCGGDLRREPLVGGSYRVWALCASMTMRGSVHRLIWCLATWAPYWDSCHGFGTVCIYMHCVLLIYAHRLVRRGPLLETMSRLWCCVLI